MKVSVIIPCYNAQAYLRECVESVLTQSERDIEVILVDDGSADGTLALANALAQQDSRVQVMHQQNAGVSAARNRGLDAARGEWVTFVDADDLLVSDALEVMLGAAKDGADMIVCAHETFDSKGNRQVFRPETNWPDLEAGKRKHAAVLRLIEGDSVLNIMCNKLHRRALLEREGIRLTQGVRIAEDALFNLEAALCGGDMVYVNRVTYRYRMHDLSAMHTLTGSELERHAPWLAAMRDMLVRRRVFGEHYAAYFDSVVLRLYKDGGVLGVMRGMEKAEALLLDVPLPQDAPVGAKLLYALARKGLYPMVYPLIFPAQLAGRKLSAAAFVLRSRKEMPV